MAEKPIMHGRDHRPGGTDPIPGLGGGLKWASKASSSTTSVSGSSSAILDMGSTSFYTNDSSVFQIASWVSGGNTYHGIQVLEDGHYLAKGQLVINGFLSATSGYVSTTWANNPGSIASYGSGGIFYDIPASSANGQMGFYVENLATVNGGSSDIWVLEVNNTSSATLTAYVDMVVFQLDTDGTRVY